MSSDREGESPCGRLNLHVFLSGIENESRLFKEARYTIEQGIFGRVVVLGLWAKGLNEHEVTDYGLEIDRLVVMIRRYRDAALLRRVALLRKFIGAVSLLQFGILAVVHARRLRPSHISCHNLMLLPIAWTMSRLSGSQLIYLPHELETHRSGLGGLMQKFQGLAESLFIHAATQVVVVCEPIAEWYRQRYGLTNVQVIRNVPEREAVEIRPVPSGSLRERLDIPASATLFIYLGIFGKARGTDSLLEIFSRLPPEAAHLVLMGYGEKEDQAIIDDFVARNRNIHYQPPVPREWIISHASGADVGLMSVVGDLPMNYRYMLPNKFFEYVHAGLPVLVSDNFELLSNIISEEGLGWSAPYTEIESLILELTKTDLTPYRAQTARFASSAVWESDASVFASVYES